MTPLVYLPGLDGSAELLFMQEEELATAFRIVKVPWRTEAPFAVEDLADDVLAVLDAAGIDRALFVAESFGGTVAIEFALAHPERVERLVLVNTFAWYPNRVLLRWGRLLATVTPPAVVHAFRVAVDTPVLMLEGVPPEARRRFFAAAYAQPLRAYRQRLEIIEAFDARERLAALRVPTLVVTCENDRVVWPEAGRLLADRIPGAQLRLLPHRGHAILLTPGVSLLRMLDEAGVRGQGTGVRVGAGIE
jgi:pimeloyl-ACP methyl ester carboxylesterase